jgi:putative ABC transport system permease protein
MHSLIQDVRFGLRALRHHRGFTAIAVLTLALGIGANTAIFSFVNAVLLSPLPFPDPDRLVVMHASEHGRVFPGPSPADARDYARRNHTLEYFSMYDYWRKNVSLGNGDKQPQEMAVGLTPSEYFEALGIRPLMGRLFTTEENETGKNCVAVISESFWWQRFRSDPNVLGRTLRINDESYTVVGVIPDAIPMWMNAPGAQLGSQPQIWTPLRPSANFDAETTRNDRGFYNVGKLKPGVTIAQANADLAVIAQQLAKQYPVDKDATVTLSPLADERSGSLRTPLLLLLGAVGLILLIACSNVANLLLVRNSARRREFAVRAALGGSQTDIVRQLLVESGLLAVIGTATGVLLAAITRDSLLRIAPSILPQLANAPMDGRVLLFSAAIAIVTTVLFGLSPAVTSTRINLAEALKEGGRSSTAGIGRRRLRALLVVGEVALTLMLMIGAGLLMRSIARLQSQEIGIRTDHLIRAHLYVPPAKYKDSEVLTRFVDTFADRVRALPGVREATITSFVPPVSRWEQSFSIVGQPPNTGQPLPTVYFGVADEHLLATYGAPLLRGRNFAPSDTPTEPTVAMVNATLGRRFFANEDPVRKKIHLGEPGLVPLPHDTRANSDLTIIGVYGDVRNEGLAKPVEPQVLVLYRQLPALNFGFKDIVVRTSQEPHAIVGAMKDQLQRMDPEIPLAQTDTIDEIIANQTSDRRFTTALLGIFALLGIALAVIGVYGVLASLVAERTHEIGIRRALGAQNERIVWLVLKPALVMGGIGAAIGLGSAWALRQVMSKLVFGISTADPVTFLGGAAFLLIAVSVATTVPAWRATRVDPMVALRDE